MCDWVTVMHQGTLEQIDTPETLYQAPTSQLVAECVTQANFLSAQRYNDGWQTEIGWFADNCLDDRLMQTHAILMMRQEALHLAVDETSGILIRDRQFLGREYRYCLVTPSGQALYARTPMRVDLQVGTAVQLSTPSATVRVFPIAVA